MKNKDCKPEMKETNTGRHYIQSLNYGKALQ